MNINEAFPSKYIKAEDLKGKSVPVYMNEVIMETLGDDLKPVLYFQGKTKGLVLNLTNKTEIEEAYGSETTHWFGKQIILYPDRTQFQGKMVPCIRLRVNAVQQPKAVDKLMVKQAQTPGEGMSTSDFIDDEIPAF